MTPNILGLEFEVLGSYTANKLMHFLKCFWL